MTHKCQMGRTHPEMAFVLTGAIETMTVPKLLVDWLSALMSRATTAVIPLMGRPWNAGFFVTMAERASRTVGVMALNELRMVTLSSSLAVGAFCRFKREGRGGLWLARTVKGVEEIGLTEKSVVAVFKDLITDCALLWMPWRERSVSLGTLDKWREYSGLTNALASEPPVSGKPLMALSRVVTVEEMLAMSASS